MANQMIQIIAARTISADLHNAIVNHPPLVSWNKEGYLSYKVNSFLVRVKAKIFPNQVVTLSGNDFPKIQPHHKIIILGGNALRLEFLSPSRNFARDYFPKDYKCQCCDLTAEKLEFSQFNTTHIRLGDIWNANSKTSKSYQILPISFYEKVFEISRKPFLLISEEPTQEQYEYLEKIISIAPGSMRMKSGCLIRDFQLLRNSTELTLATSTYSWLAAWLSESAESVFIPKVGLFDPSIRPDIDLISSDLDIATIIEVN